MQTKTVPTKELSIRNGIEILLSSKPVVSANLAQSSAKIAQINALYRLSLIVVTKC